MFKVQQNRYLWVHLVGLAAVPLLLDICLAGLASAGSALPFKVQFWLIALTGIVPSAWMQIQRPFYIYALPPLAVKPTSLSEDERRCLTVLKSWQIKALAGVTAGFLLWLLVQLYEKLPQVSPVMEPGVGLVSAIAAFFFACLFLQISVSVVRSLLIGRDTLKRVKPFETDKIISSFFIPGLRIKKIFSTQLAAPEVSVSERSKEPPINTPSSRKQFFAEVKEARLETETKSEIEQIQPTEELAEPDIDLAEDLEEITAEPPSEEDLEASEPSTTEPAEASSIEVEEAKKEPPLVIPEVIESEKFDSNSN